MAHVMQITNHRSLADSPPVYNARHEDSCGQEGSCCRQPDTQRYCTARSFPSVPSCPSSGLRVTPWHSVLWTLSHAVVAPDRVRIFPCHVIVIHRHRLTVPEDGVGVSVAGVEIRVREL